MFLFCNLTKIYCCTNLIPVACIITTVFLTVTTNNNQPNSDVKKAESGYISIEKTLCYVMHESRIKTLTLKRKDLSYFSPMPFFNTNWPIY